MDRASASALADTTDAMKRWDAFVRAILREERPALTFPRHFPCDLAVGDVVPIKTLRALGRPAAQVTIEVTRVHTGNHFEHLIDYRVRDDRPRYMHRDSSRLDASIERRIKAYEKRVRAA